MVEILENLQEEIRKKGLSLKSREAKEWLQRKVKSLRITPNKVLRSGPPTFHPLIGKMYFYYYDPKTKDKLEFWDKFPLVIPIEYYDDGFLGLNLHYLDMNTRIMLVNELMRTIKTKNIDENTKLKINYKILKRAKRLRAAQPCLKRYLTPFIKSHLIEVDVSEFSYAILLPVERFAKVPKNDVFKQSRRMIYG